MKKSPCGTRTREAPSTGLPRFPRPILGEGSILVRPRPMRFLQLIPSACRPSSTCLSGYWALSPRGNVPLRLSSWRRVTARAWTSHGAWCADSQGLCAVSQENAQMGSTRHVRSALRAILSVLRMSAPSVRPPSSPRAVQGFEPRSRGRSGGLQSLPRRPDVERVPSHGLRTRSLVHR